MFAKLSIAGPGEEAERVARTADRLGIAVTRMEPAKAGGWLNPIEVVRVAREAGAQAVHPGRLAPPAQHALSVAVREAGLAYVGPSTSALELLADRVALRAAAAAAGLGVIPGSDAPVADAAAARAWVEELGAPVVLKPVAGFGSIGIQIVDDEDEVAHAFAAAREQAAAELGDDRLFVERFVPRARQLEVTVVRDAHGNCAVLGEREHSLRRRKRSILIEAPAPFLSFQPDAELVRESIAETARAFAEELDIVGVVTLELLADEDGHLRFVDCNAGFGDALLLTELVAGIDPIEVELAIAAGDPLPPEIVAPFSGHAFEVLLLAEDPRGGFRPDTRTVDTLRFPPAPQGKVRFEPSIEAGGAVTRPTEPLLGRVATRGTTRHQALLALDRALAEAEIAPVATNLTFLREALNHESFRAGHYDAALCDTLIASAPA